MTLFISISPLIWAKRQQILVFVRRNDGVLGGIGAVISLFAILLMNGQSLTQIIGRYELYPTFALAPSALISRRVALYRMRKRQSKPKEEK